MYFEFFRDAFEKGNYVGMLLALPGVVLEYFLSSIRNLDGFEKRLLVVGWLLASIAIAILPAVERVDGKDMVYFAPWARWTIGIFLLTPICLRVFGSVAPWIIGTIRGSYDTLLRSSLEKRKREEDMQVVTFDDEILVVIDEDEEFAYLEDESIEMSNKR